MATWGPGTHLLPHLQSTRVLPSYVVPTERHAPTPGTLRVSHKCTEVPIFSPHSPWKTPVCPGAARPASLPHRARGFPKHRCIRGCATRACSLTPGVGGTKASQQFTRAAKRTRGWAAGQPGRHRAPVRCPEPHHSNGVTEPLTRDVFGDKGTLFLQKKDGLQGLRGAVGNNPATIQRAEREAPLQGVRRSRAGRRAEPVSWLSGPPQVRAPPSPVQLHAAPLQEDPPTCCGRRTRRVHAPTPPAGLPSTLRGSPVTLTQVPTNAVPLPARAAIWKRL